MNLDKKVFLKTNELLFNKAIISNLSVISGSIFIVVLIQKHVSKPSFIIFWLSIMILLSLLRIVVYLQAKKNKNILKYKPFYFVLTVLIGLGWAIIPFFPYKEFSSFPEIFNIFIMFTLITLGIQALFYDKLMMLLYIAPMPLSLTARFLISREDYSLFISIAIIFFFIVLVLFALKHSRDIKSLLSLQFKNEEIMEREKKSKLEAEKASQVKSQFISTISHEIRTPLNAIIGFISLLEEEKDIKKQKEYIEIIKKSAENLLEILNDILDFSEIENKTIKLNIKTVNLKELIAQTASAFLEKAEEKGLKFEYNIDNALSVLVQCDTKKLEQIIINLLNNAIKFTDKGYVRLNARAKKKSNRKLTALLEIFDTGIGIPHEKLETIFTPFQQADSSLTRKFGGTGLGLSIVKSFAEYYNGEIKVESTPGKGSKFYVTLNFNIAENNLQNKPSLTLKKEFLVELIGNNDKIIEDLINSFQKTFKNSIYDLEEGIYENHHKKILTALITLKSSASTLNLTEICNILENMEFTLKNRNMELLKEYIRELKNINIEVE